MTDREGLGTRHGRCRTRSGDLLLVVFTYDDYQSGQSHGPYPQPPNHVRSIREARYKLAEYYDPSSKHASQWEMYDLRRDPLERKNLTARHYRRTAEEERPYVRLRRTLARVRATRLRPLSGGAAAR